MKRLKNNREIFIIERNRNKDKYGKGYKVGELNEKDKSTTCIRLICIRLDYIRERSFKFALKNTHMPSARHNSNHEACSHFERKYLHR